MTQQRSVEQVEKDTGRKLIRFVENHRLEGRRIFEKSMPDGHRCYVYENTQPDGRRVERAHMRQPMVEKFTFIDFEKRPVTEANVMGKNVEVPEGVLGILEFELMSSADVKTANNTLYTFADLKREVASYKKNYVARGKAWGGEKHPSWDEDFRIEFSNAAIRWFMMEFDQKTGVVSGAGYLLDKEEGTNVRAGLRSGGTVAVSSRGWGWAEKYSEYEGIHGTVEDVWVVEDFILDGYDIVTDPGTIGAETTDFYTEARSQPSERGGDSPIRKQERQESEPHHRQKDRPMNLKELKEKHPELFEAVMQEGRSQGRVEANAEFELAAEARKSKLVESLTGGEAPALVARDQYDSLLSANQDLTSQVEAVTQERDELTAKIESVTQERDELTAKIEAAEAAKLRAEVQAEVEKALAGHSHAEAIKRRLSESDMASVDAAKAAIEREFEFHATYYNIPKSPITQTQIENMGKGKTGGGDDEDKPTKQADEGMSAEAKKLDDKIKRMSR